MFNYIIKFFLENKLIAFLLLFLLVGWGLITSPFQWNVPFLPNNPVPVDAIPDIGENQQIVFTEWDGRSPRDIEDQITYPLTTTLMGLPGVKAVRSNSMFGFSSINIIFDDNVEFYWSRARILEKLNALPTGLLPEGVQPALGPDATALGQVFWYTLEGMDSDENPTGGWDLHELRSIQDFQVRYALSSVRGVAEVASIGGFVQEYQVDIDPIAMREFGVNISQIANAVRGSNLDVGARTMEINRAEYIVRGLGYIQSLEDIEESVITVVNDIPVRIKDVAKVVLGPAQRRGMLDKAGAEAVGGVVTARYGENPLEVIENIKERINEISPGLPGKELADGTSSQVTIVPFYDRTGLIYETLGTLEEALSLQILITIIVIIVMVMHLRSAFIVSALLPVAVLISFILMKYMGVDANVVALAGIAISIGTVVDMGIIMTENMLRHLEESDKEEKLFDIVYRAASEVSPAIATALLTTIVSFLPVFMLEASEGKLFGPLAYTKTFVLLAALVITFTMIPAIAHVLFSYPKKASPQPPPKEGEFSLTPPLEGTGEASNILLIAVGVFASFILPWAGILLVALSLSNVIANHYQPYKKWNKYVNLGLILLSISWLLASYWLPLGAANSVLSNLIFVLILIALVLSFFRLFIYYYERMLTKLLQNKGAFLLLPLLIIILGLLSWRGFDRTFTYIGSSFESVGWEIRESGLWTSLNSTFPGLQREFMPKFDEGSFLVMPTTMPHAGIEETIDIVRKMDMRIMSIPEIENVVGKVGRAESPLDPAPISMFENVVIYKSEYKSDERGRRIRFKVENGEFVRDNYGELIPDRRGRYYRQWRDEISSPNDIWNEIAAAAKVPGATSAPKLQPIETRIVMLQTGMRANIGMKVSGPNLETIDRFSLQLEEIIREVPGIRQPSVFADRVVGKPYIEIDFDRREIARHGLTIQDVQNVINTGIGGMPLTSTVEGRERYNVRVRYAREYRNSPEMMERVLIPASNGAQIPLGQLAEIRFETGPMSIRSENSFLINYVTFDSDGSTSAVEAVENIRSHLNELIGNGELTVPNGVSWTFEGEFRNQQRASERFALIIPITLVIIFLLMYFQFRSTPVTLMIFSGITVAWAGGFIMLWLYGQPWFLNIDLLGMSIQQLLQIDQIHLSVAVWVGFLALFGIAVDDGVVMATYLKQSFEKNKTESIEGIRKATIKAGMRRVRPCLMTTGTTLLALLPILTSTGKGSDIMLPMAVPIFGGMLFQVITLFVLPVLWCWWEEKKLNLEVSS